MVQNLAGGTSYTGLSPVVIGDDPESDLLVDHRELWKGSFWKKQTKKKKKNMLSLSQSQKL